MLLLLFLLLVLLAEVEVEEKGWDEDLVVVAVPDEERMAPPRGC